MYLQGKTHFIRTLSARTQNALDTLDDNLYPIESRETSYYSKQTEEKYLSKVK
jgi:hypothetical protein